MHSFETKETSMYAIAQELVWDLWYGHLFLQNFLRLTVYCILTIHSGKGLFYTFDLAKCDAEGNIQVTGRVDDAIRIKGVWLEVPKIESVMVRM